METFFLGYRDPLVGLIVFFALIFIIAFFSYWWALYQSKRQFRKIDRFFRRFESRSDTTQERKALLQLVEAYARSGDYEEAVALLQKLRSDYDIEENLRILQRMGDLYLRAGFLERSKTIYEQILQITPRNIPVLESLLVVEELLGDFEGCFDVLESLEELKDVKKERGYIESCYYAQKGDVEGLVGLYDRGISKRSALESLFALDTTKAWEVVQEEDLPLIVDILWYLPKEKIALRFSYLKELYSAKGYVKEVEKSKVFEFDLLLHYPKADLEFEYLCTSCKKRFPLFFGRCPNCREVESMKIEISIVKKERKSEESLSI